MISFAEEAFYVDKLISAYNFLWSKKRAIIAVFTEVLVPDAGKQRHKTQEHRSMTLRR